MCARMFALALLGTLVLPFMAYSHCHNDRQYENPATIKGGDYWPDSHKNDEDDIEIDYKVNQNKPGMPDLGAASQLASAHWSSIPFQGRRVDFKFTYKGRATVPHPDVDNEDDLNLVAWDGLGGPNSAPAECHLYISNNEIEEFDILLNYYYDWTHHADRYQNPTKYCTLDVLTHEFGHGAGLDDVYYEPGGSDREKWCVDYRYYTMNGTSAGGEHFRTTLACEDKYAMYDKY